MSKGKTTNSKNYKFTSFNDIKTNPSYRTRAEYLALLYPLGDILWRTSQNTIEVIILMQISGPGILQFSPKLFKAHETNKENILKF